MYGGSSCDRENDQNITIWSKQTEQPIQKVKHRPRRKIQQGINLTLNFTGDCILGTDEQFAWDTGFNAYYEANGPEYFLKNVRDIFRKKMT